MDRARAEVKSAEERKRRRVQRVLAITVLGLLAVAGFAGWWIDSVKSQRRAEQQAQQLKNEAEEKDREAERKARQIAYERDVKESINEAEEILRRGREKDDDLEFWSIALGAAVAPMQRAEKLIKSGEPTKELRRAYDDAARRAGFETTGTDAFSPSSIASPTATKSACSCPSRSPRSPRDSSPLLSVPTASTY